MKIELTGSKARDYNSALFRLYYNRGEVLDRIMGFQQSLKNYRTMERLARDLGDRKQQLRARVEAAYRLTMQGRMDEALAEHNAVTGELMGESSSDVYCRNQERQAIALRQLGRYEEALAAQEQLCRAPAGDGEVRFNRINSLGHTLWRMGRYQDAIDSFQQVLTWAADSNRTALQATAHNNLGLVYSDQERLDEAMDHHQKSLRLRAELHDLGSICTSYLNLGNVMVQTGNTEKGLALWEKALEICLRLGDKSTEAMIENNMGEVSYKTGDYTKAAEHFCRSLKMKESLNLRSYLDTSLEGLAKTYFEMRDQPEYAEQCRYYGRLLLELDTARPQKLENVRQILAALDGGELSAEKRKL